MNETRVSVNDLFLLSFSMKKKKIKQHSKTCRVLHNLFFETTSSSLTKNHLLQQQQRNIFCATAVVSGRGLRTVPLFGHSRARQWLFYVLNMLHTHIHVLRYSRGPERTLFIVCAGISVNTSSLLTAEMAALRRVSSSRSTISTN